MYWLQYSKALLYFHFHTIHIYGTFHSLILTKLTRVTDQETWGKWRRHIVIQMATAGRLPPKVPTGYDFPFRAMFYFLFHVCVHCWTRLVLLYDVDFSHNGHNPICSTFKLDHLFESCFLLIILLLCMLPCLLAVFPQAVAYMIENWYGIHSFNINQRHTSKKSETMFSL